MTCTPRVKSPERNALVGSGETGDHLWLPAELLWGNCAVTGHQKLCYIIHVGRIITSKYLEKIFAFHDSNAHSYQFLLQ